MSGTWAWSIIQIACGVLVALPVLRSPDPLTPGQRLSSLVLVLASLLFVWAGAGPLLAGIRGKKYF